MLSQNKSKPMTSSLDPNLYSKTVSEGKSIYRWGAPSTLDNRIRAYKKGLIRTTGYAKPLFDDKIIDLLLKYSRQPKEVNKVIDYLNQLTDEEGNKFSRNLKEYGKISSQLRGFVSDNHRNFYWNKNYKLALKQVSSSLRITGLKALRYHCDDDIKEVLPKANTHSGFTYLLSGKRCKGDNMDGLLLKMNKHLQKIKTDGFVSIPNLIAFRTQASGEFDSVGNRTNTCKHKTRMVAMVDLVNIANELQFSYPFMERFKHVVSFAGGKDDVVIGSIISGLRSRYKYHTSLDYSLFDQSISDWLIRDALKIVRDCFDVKDDEDFKFNCVIESFINKEFLIDKGILVSKKGIPSGSMFTQIVGSIVNQLVIQSYLNSKDLVGEMIVMGDDNLVFSNVQLDIKELSNYVKHNFGMEINPTKSTQGDRSTHPEFLSRVWSYVGPIRNWQSVVSRLAFPERFRDYSGEVKPYLVLYAYILTYRNIGEIMDVGRFILDHRLNKTEVRNVDSRYIPGVMSYLREYELD